MDRFLRWECGRHLLGLGLFPDAKEISESVACLQAVLEHCAQHAFSPASGDTLVVCVGDGRTPRTAALVAMRSRWDCVSIDPALAGLEPPAAGEEGEGGSGDGGSSGGGECDSRCGECSDGDPAAEPLARLEKVAQARRGGGGGGAPKPLPVPKELRHANLLSQEASDAARAQRARLRTELRSIARLRLLSCRAEEAAVWVAARVTSVVVMLPHAHVTPDEALGCLRFGGERERGSAASPLGTRCVRGRGPCTQLGRLSLFCYPSVPKSSSTMTASAAPSDRCSDDGRRLVGREGRDSNSLTPEVSLTQSKTD